MEQKKKRGGQFKPPEKKVAIISASIPVPLAEQLKAFVESSGKTRSEIITAALTAHLKKQKPAS